MPTPYCVPGCRGNYKKGPRVNVFGFLTDADLAAKWEEKIHMEAEFKPSAYTKVRELHFETHDVIRSVMEHDLRTGRRITVQLDRPRLAPGAVLPDDQAIAKENEQPAQALNERYV